MDQTLRVSTRMCIALHILKEPAIAALVPFSVLILYDMDQGIVKLFSDPDEDQLAGASASSD